MLCGAFYLQPTKILKTYKKNGSISRAMLLDQRVIRTKGGISAETRFRPNLFISPLLSVSSTAINIKRQVATPRECRWTGSPNFYISVCRDLMRV